MANAKDLNFTYSTIDEIFRLSLGETGDYSGAKYDGDFSMSLEEAQAAKHKFIADSLNIRKGSKVLDMCCGWGPFSRYITDERGAISTGLTLSSAQAAACQRNGLNVLVKDCKTVLPEDYGKFDAIVCIGGLEHFCSVEEWKNGNQETIYQNFFQSIADLLEPGGRAYIQTMVFSKNMIDYELLDLKAPKGSAENVMALMVAQFPGSWLPYGDEMVIRNASPYFKLISKSSGRLDYIETISQWRQRFRKFHPKKYWLYLRLFLSNINDKDFKYQIEVFKTSPNKICFEKEIMDHFRLVFEKTP
ncbi:hypothetical protein GCM10007049_33430 [Echinicola pacifica]|uniref:Cyclopropane-fatty-acyl-phospholipid synthase n=1 Tax=Echinicola pacifica TaxID=346377 RepID=A0A918QA83_9BACT|nr:class I SAM-dependent methyltransferase [Echinicola pacifica]GGZ37531.1 hypothetical protein GCM10007049_33430 [Echinicola pacifica]